MRKRILCEWYKNKKNMKNKKNKKNIKNKKLIINYIYNELLKIQIPKRIIIQNGIKIYSIIL